MTEYDFCALWFNLKLNFELFQLFFISYIETRQRELFSEKRAFTPSNGLKKKLPRGLSATKQVIICVSSSEIASVSRCMKISLFRVKIPFEAGFERQKRWKFIFPRQFSAFSVHNTLTHGLYFFLRVSFDKCPSIKKAMREKIKKKFFLFPSTLSTDCDSHTSDGNKRPSRCFRAARGTILIFIEKRLNSVAKIFRRRLELCGERGREGGGKARKKKIRREKCTWNRTQKQRFETLAKCFVEIQHKHMKMAQTKPSRAKSFSFSFISLTSGTFIKKASV